MSPKSSQLLEEFAQCTTEAAGERCGAALERLADRRALDAQEALAAHITTLEGDAAADMEALRLMRRTLGTDQGWRSRGPS